MKKLLSIAVLAALGAVSQAQASITVKINPDAAGVDPVLNVGAIDWTVGNALSVADAGERIAGDGPYVGQQFTTYAMARLATFNDASGTPTLLPSGYEWTFVAAFREQFTAVAQPAGAGASSFVTLGGPASATNFFEIWFDPTPNSSNLTGKGFNDGILVLSGHFAGGQGAFTAADTLDPTDPAGTPVIAPLDGFGNNDYAGITTVTGNGSTSGMIVVDSVNPSFFLSAPASLTLDFTSEQKLAFNTTNPAACFWTGAAYLGGAGNGADCANTIGTINGVNGTNVQFQADGSNSFDGKVPEPGSLALLGLGFAAFGALRRKVAA